MYTASQFHGPFLFTQTTISHPVEVFSKFKHCLLFVNIWLSHATHYSIIWVHTVVSKSFQTKWILSRHKDTQIAIHTSLPKKHYTNYCHLHAVPQSLCSRDEEEVCVYVCNNNGKLRVLIENVQLTNTAFHDGCHPNKHYWTQKELCPYLPHSKQK